MTDYPDMATYQKAQQEAANRAQLLTDEELAEAIDPDRDTIHAFAEWTAMTREAARRLRERKPT